jgi:hypothetical protein
MSDYHITFDQLRTTPPFVYVPRWARRFPTLWAMYAALSSKQQAARERRFLHNVYKERARAKMGTYWSRRFDDMLAEALGL